MIYGWSLISPMQDIKSWPQHVDKEERASTSASGVLERKFSFLFRSCYWLCFQLRTAPLRYRLRV